MLFPPPQRQQDLRYLRLGRQALHRYDNTPRSVTFPLVLAELREDRLQGALPVWLITLATNTVLAAALLSGAAFSAPALSGIMIVAGLLNSLSLAGVQKYLQTRQTLNELGRDHTQTGAEGVRRNLARLGRNYPGPSQRPGRIARLLDGFFTRCNIRNRRPLLETAPPCPTGSEPPSAAPRQLQQKPALMAVSDPLAPAPAGENEIPPGPLHHDFLKVTRLLVRNALSYQTLARVNPETALSYAAIKTETELAILHPAGAFRRAVSRLYGRPVMWKEFELLHHADEVLRAGLRQPGKPTLTQMLDYLEARIDPPRA